MDWSFRLLMAFAAAGAILALDHYLLGGAVTGLLAGLASAAI